MNSKYCRFVAGLTLGAVLSCASLVQAEIRMPAEFEPQKALWIGWPTYDYVREFSATDTVLEMIEAVQAHTHVVVQVIDEGDISSVQGQIAARGIPLNNIEFVAAKRDDIWIRDMGPVFRYNDDVKEMVDFQFTGWGAYGKYEPYSQTEGNLDRLLAEELDLDIATSWLVHEGGNHEFNGQGTMMMTWAVEKQRNPETNAALNHYLYGQGNVDGDNQREIMEAEYKRIFNVSKIIWLEEGLVEDPFAFTSIPGPEPGTRGYAINLGGGGMHCISAHEPADL